MKRNPNADTFIKITNKDVYNEIKTTQKTIDERFDELHEMLIKERVHRKIIYTTLTLYGAAISYMAYLFVSFFRR